MAGLAAPARAVVLAPATTFDVRLFELHPGGERNEMEGASYGRDVWNWFFFNGAFGQTRVDEVALGNGRYRIDITLSADPAFSGGAVEMFRSYSGYYADWGDGQLAPGCDPNVPEEGWTSCTFVDDPTAGLRVGLDDPLDLSEPFTLERALLSFEGREGFSSSTDLIDVETPIVAWNGALADGRAAGGIAGLAGKGVHTVRLQLTGTQGTVPVAVPEPSVWTIMIVGFGLCGTRLRRRAKARPASAFNATPASSRLTQTRAATRCGWIQA